jgi:CRISPR-associated endonuclease/helicase Cas3
MLFTDWFCTLTEHTSPRPWQERLAARSSCRSQLVRIPTGLGKTQGVLAAWSYNRLALKDHRWPTRLVWCLPMRVLVEQTEATARELASRMPVELRPTIHVAMGGEDSGDWFLNPEKPAVIVGTQDMLLSRALNRGYAAARGRWPAEFGLLNHDALWVLDEVQLMDVALATSGQLQAYRDQDQAKSLRPCHSWWMSATLQPQWLCSVDSNDWHRKWVVDPCVVSAEERREELWETSKALFRQQILGEESQRFAELISAEHKQIEPKEFGKITLVVCNTVKRACETAVALRTLAPNTSVELVHSRFRPSERESWREKFLGRTSCGKGADRIIVATQVVEAGVDISATCLVTELAPWPSLVQRFGRCARYGGTGKVVVVDRRLNEEDTLPYGIEELDASWAALEDLSDVGIKALEEFEEQLPDASRERLYPYKATQLLLREEFEDLFDTNPDLSGADIDISRFIRSGEERDIQLFWLDIPKAEKPPSEGHPHRRELCTAPFLQVRDWLCGKEKKSNRKPKLLSSMRAWIWDWLEGSWVEATRAKLFPGQVVCVASKCGGYRVESGFDVNSKEFVPSVPAVSLPVELGLLESADEQQDGDQLSYLDWKTIGLHVAEVAKEVANIATNISLSARQRELLELAAYWHDWGKSHPAFQGAIAGLGRPERNDLAKAPRTAWRKPPNLYRDRETGEVRPAFRHELASALGLFALLGRYAPEHPALLGKWTSLFGAADTAGQDTLPIDSANSLVQRLVACSAEEFDLVVYLVASHHGKVRVGLHPAPADQNYCDRDGRGMPIRGIREGDTLPALEFSAEEPSVPSVCLSLSPATLGLSNRTGISWRERCIGLVNQFGPSALAYLESLLRAADVRASRLATGDRALEEEFTR